MSQPKRRKEVLLVSSLLLSILLVALPESPAAGGTPVIPAAELLERVNSGSVPLILDVRSEEEFGSGHIPGALNIPQNEIGERLGEIRSFQDKEVVVQCESGRRASIAEEHLRGAGFKKLKHLEGDMRAWRRDARPLETSTGD